MNLNFLCCVGAELKNSTTQTTRMPQIYFYRAFEDETIENMLSPGFFDSALGIIRKDDLLLLYDPKNDSARWVYARVTEADRDGVIVEKMSINGIDVSVDTTGFSELDADNLQTLAEQINSRLSELRGKITQETQDRKDAVQAEADARTAADTVLQSNIDTVSGNLSTHINDKNNPHAVTKAQVGLGNVDDTSDADKPVSTATQTELDKKENTSNKVTTITSSSTNVQYPSAKAAKDYADKAAGLAANPVGSFISYAGTMAPDGYLICDGAAISRITYASLFDKIGGQFSTGIFNWIAANDSSYFTNSATLSDTPITAYNADGSVAGTMKSFAGNTQAGVFTPTGGTAQPAYARNADADKPTFNLPNCANGKIITENAPVMSANGNSIYLFKFIDNGQATKISVSGVNIGNAQVAAMESSFANVVRDAESNMVADFSKYTTVLICIKY